MLKRISLFHQSNKNAPVIKAIKKYCKKNTRVLEVGCGEGHLLELLSKNCKQVVAIDRSKDMLTKAVKKAGHIKNVTFIRDDFFGYRTNNKFEVILAVNSLIEGKHSDFIASFNKIYRFLKPKGTFIGIFPSMEAYIYLANLNLYTLLGKSKNIENTKTQLHKKTFRDLQFDFYGNYKIKGKKQKFCYDFELKLLSKIVGYKKYHIKKVYFSWDYLFQQGLTLPFKEHEEFWCWMLVASK